MGKYEGQHARQNQQYSSSSSRWASNVDVQDACVCCRSCSSMFRCLICYMIGLKGRRRHVPYAPGSGVSQQTNRAPEMKVENFTVLMPPSAFPTKYQPRYILQQSINFASCTTTTSPIIIRFQRRPSVFGIQRIDSKGTRRSSRLTSQVTTATRTPDMKMGRQRTDGPTRIFVDNATATSVSSCGSGTGAGVLRLHLRIFVR